MNKLWREKNPQLLKRYKQETDEVRCPSAGYDLSLETSLFQRGAYISLSL